MFKDKNLVSTIILIGGAIIFILYIAFKNLKFFVNSNFFLALVTLLVGSVAISLYIFQKRARKRDAANIILMEVRYAESAIDRIKRGETIEPLYVLLPKNNWSKYSYLFVGDLDRDEIDLINDFYNQCEMIDKSLAQLSLSSQLDQKSNHIHREIVNIARQSSDEYSGKEEAKKNFEDRKNAFLNIIGSDGYAFHPTEPINKIMKNLLSVQKITTSSAGNIFKKIAKLK